MIEMIAAIKPAHGDHLHRHADHSVATSASTRAEHEAAGPGRQGGGEIGADHVERAVRQIDQVHDAEHQRQSRRQQKQQQSELQPVQALLDEKRHGALIVERGPVPISERRRRGYAAAAVSRP